MVAVLPVNARISIMGEAPQAGPTRSFDGRE